MGVGSGCGQEGGAKGVTESGLLNGAVPSVRAVPGAELWDNAKTEYSL